MKFTSIACFIWAATTTTAFSQPLIEEEQRLDFGVLAVASNASVSRFTYPRSGSNISIEGQFVLIARGTPGLFQLSGFPAFTQISVSLDTTTLNAGASGSLEPITVDNYDTAELTTNSLGEAELSLGARLTTTGTASSYVDAPFTGSTVLRVDYWSPDVRAYVFNTKRIDMEVELRSSLSIDEEQQLSFGTLFARSASTEQAVLSLSPSGSFTISEPGNTRLVSLVKPGEGVFRVSGAASNYSLNISPQVTDVLLEHTVSPGGAPHLILSDLMTSPNGIGISDENGELLIKIGGTLKTEITALPTIYPSGQYEGTYELTVAY